MRYIIKKTHCDVIFHCAAYKHVPLMEENPVAAVENNVFGTKNILEAALECKIQRFVLISTDKAVEPVSVYGCSKMLCEKLVIDAAKKAGNESSFMFVRFGNVLGSRGSILPLFIEQIKNGGPLTVTSKKMERFFMTIPEACSLVLQTGGVGKNGSSYLLDMGEPVKIVTLAEQIIRFSGLEPYKDIDIKFIGARKGERDIEPLWLTEEKPAATEYKKILELTNIDELTVQLEQLLEQLEPVCIFNKNKAEFFRNKEKLIEILAKAVPSYNEFLESTIKSNYDRNF